MLWRLLYRSYRTGSGLWHWLTRRLTTAGLVMFGALLFATTLAVDTENMVAYQGFALLVFMMLLGFLFTIFFSGRFGVERILPRFGTVGQPLNYRIAVQNLTSKTQSGLSVLEELVDPRPSFAEWKAVQLADQERVRPFRPNQRRHKVNPYRRAKFRDAPVPTLEPNGQADAKVELTPLRRGILRFKGVSVARTDPFGLFRALRPLPAPQTALVLPRRYQLPPVALPGTMKYQEGGVAMASNVGRSDEFVALRDYRRGDPLRHIHWRSWAKAGKPVVKEYADEFFVRHALVLDTFTKDPYNEEFEEAVSIAASFAATIRTQESLLDLLFVEAEAFCFTAGRGLAHTEQMLAVLASVQACGNKPFKVLADHVTRHARSVSGCICVLLAWDEDRRKFVEKLQMMGSPLLVFVVAPPGKAAGVDPGPMRGSPGQFHVLETGQVEQGLAKL